MTSYFDMGKNTWKNPPLEMMEIPPLDPATKSMMDKLQSVNFIRLLGMDWGVNDSIPASTIVALDVDPESGKIRAQMIKFAGESDPK